MNTKTYEFEWHGIRISLMHTHKKWGVIEHLEIRSIDPKGAALPFTDTGYRSHFMREEDLNEYGSPLEFVLAWLDNEANQPHWKRQELKSRQYSLF